MNEGYSILVWDMWGLGFSRVNPRLLSEGTCSKGFPINWWRKQERDTTQKILDRHGANRFNFAQIIWDNENAEYD